jgi:hypothetical protein
MSKECNVMECLRKFRENSTSDISRWCGIYGYEKDQRLIHNSKDCPFFCDKFYDYQLKKIIDKHEDVYWINDDKEKDRGWDKHSNGMSIGLFVGISRIGYEKQEKESEWENKHEYCDKVVCPYCDYEFDDCNNPYEEGEEEQQCPDCGKKFNCTTNISYSWSTSKLEEYEDNEENE